MPVIVNFFQQIQSETAKKAIVLGLWRRGMPIITPYGATDWKVVAIWRIKVIHDPIPKL